MDYGWGPAGGAWVPFLCGFLLAILMSLMPTMVLAMLWLQAEARHMLSRLEELLEEDDKE